MSNNFAGLLPILSDIIFKHQEYYITLHGLLINDNNIIFNDADASHSCQLGQSCFASPTIRLLKQGSELLSLFLLSLI